MLSRKRYLLAVVGLFVVTVGILYLYQRDIQEPSIPDSLYRTNDNVTDFSGANNVTGFSLSIVPNIVHYVHFGKPELSFIEAVSILSVHQHHRPDAIYVHCNCTHFSGKYWDKVKDIPNLRVAYLEQPRTVFGKQISYVEHASDVARIGILMKYGGIYLDSDTYVVKSLDKYRKFEMTLPWPTGAFLGAQILLAHRKARFLREWLQCYRDYRPDLWYYNAGELPTKKVLWSRPELVHRVPSDLFVGMGISFLYSRRSDEWKQYSAIHLLINHKGYMIPDDPVKVFDEENIKTYNRSFGDMVRLVWFGSSDFVTGLSP